jgi:RimJ/RimL family protein N-acetyltransferase
VREVPNLETPRLLIRPFEAADLDAACQLFDVDLADAEMGADKLTSRAEREDWLRWSVLNHRQLALLNQPPYGDRAIVLKENGVLIGSCGYVPALDAFEQLPGWPGMSAPNPNATTTAEFALFYALSLGYRGRGFVIEAVSALIDYAFTHLHLKRIIAETDFDNAGSIAVMKRLGMRVLTNTTGTPAHLQVVGVLEQHDWESPDRSRG